MAYLCGRVGFNAAMLSRWRMEYIAAASGAVAAGLLFVVAHAVLPDDAEPNGGSKSSPTAWSVKTSGTTPMTCSAIA